MNVIRCVLNYVLRDAEVAWFLKKWVKSGGSARAASETFMTTLNTFERPPRNSRAYHHFHRHSSIALHTFIPLLY